MPGILTEYYNMDGQPIDIDTWGALYEDFPRRVLAEDVHLGVIIRTVWFGHNEFPQDDPPKIFGSTLDGAAHAELRTYSTQDEALAGHAELAAKLKTGELLPHRAPAREEP